MHHIFHTDSFILGSRPSGEDSKIIYLYTRELGLVHAHAQGVRKLSSKLRFILQDGSRVNVDLVRGREIWRLASATPSSFDNVFSPGTRSFEVITRIMALTRRLVMGEEANEELFQTLVRTFELFQNQSLKKEDYKTLEMLSVARILIALGYLPRDLVSDENDMDNLSQVEKQYELVRNINMALAATQLNNTGGR